MSGDAGHSFRPEKLGRSYLNWMGCRLSRLRPALAIPAFDRFMPDDHVVKKSLTLPLHRLFRDATCRRAKGDPGRDKIEVSHEFNKSRC